MEPAAVADSSKTLPLMIGAPGVGCGAIGTVFITGIIGAVVAAKVWHLVRAARRTGCGALPRALFAALRRRYCAPSSSVVSSTRSRG